MSDGRRIVEIYDRVMVYEFEDNAAYEVTPNGRREVSVRYALDRISSWRERDGRYYAYAMSDVRRRGYWLMAAAMFIVTLGLAVVLLKVM